MPHHAAYTALAVLIAVIGSWTALDLFRRVRAHAGKTRAGWLAAAALAMGLSIWSMHFIAMLGFDPGSPVQYDPLLTVLSLALAVGATGGAFFLAAGGGFRLARLLPAGVGMGLGICLMHYVGMAAVRSTASLGYKPGLVAASFAVAIIASTAALIAARAERGVLARSVAALALGLAIVGMHYTAMAALMITLEPGAPAIAEPGGVPPAVLAGEVALGTLVLLTLALFAAMFDRRSEVAGALEAARVGYWELLLPGRQLRASPQATVVLGYAPDAIITYEDFEAVVHPEDQERRKARLAEALGGNGEYSAEYRVVLPDGAVRWIDLRGRIVFDSRRRPRKLIGIVLDATDRHLARAAAEEGERRQRLLVNELNHRVKNTLVTVQSFAAQSFRSEACAPDRARFEARLLALSRAHDILTQENWDGANVGEVVEAALSPFGERVAASGPHARLSPRAALALAMTLHELATNASKYGSLSTENGRVALDWGRSTSASGDARWRLTWRESGGPPVTAPERRGFGTRLIERQLAHELGGEVEIDFRPEGLICTLSFATEQDADPA